MIRNGLVENKSTSFGSARISAADRFKALGEPACETIGQMAGISVREDALNRPIPIVFGTARVRLTRLDDTRYMAAENATGVVRVFDRNGNAIAGASISNGIIALPGGAAEATEAIVRGNSDNRIGQVIRWLLENRAGVPFNATNFNMTEYNAYANGSFRVNYAITGGTIRGAIEEALRSDMAFFVQQTDGRFTLRSYQRRGAYPLHEIPSWATTKKPEKDYGRAQDNYFSSCFVEWVNDNGDAISELYDGRAGEAERRYRRRVQKTFATNLTSAGNARTLAGVLSDRYSHMRQVIKVSVGINTAPFELLDRVRVDLTINDRRFSHSNNFIITAINHSQDILTLEEID